jgi:hypothetical protein
MSIVYTKNEDNIKTGTFSFDPMKVDAVRHYETHFSNLMYLDFFVRNPRATFQEKRQAESEMLIAKRKLTYWMRIAKIQGNDNQIPDVIQKVKKKWS